MISDSHYDESVKSVDGSKWNFFEQLARYGPSALGPQSTAANNFSLDDAEKYCRFVARAHYENFQIVSWLVPRHLRQDFVNIYSFCRWSDDCGDEAGSTQSATELLQWWQGELQSLYAGLPPRHPVLIALKKTIERHAIDQQPFLDLISAFQQDQTQTRYDTTEQLNDYCRRSANPVGRLVLSLDRSAITDENLRLSDEICTGLQLANFCQDMSRDAALGRIYAPRELWQKHNVDEAMILAARPTANLAHMLEEWVQQAKAHFIAGASLEKQVPKWLAMDIHLFRAGGLAILNEIEKARFDVWTRRPTVTKWHKVRLLLRACMKR